MLQMAFMELERECLNHKHVVGRVLNGCSADTLFKILNMHLFTFRVTVFFNTHTLRACINLRVTSRFI